MLAGPQSPYTCQAAPESGPSSASNQHRGHLAGLLKMAQSSHWSLTWASLFGHIELVWKLKKLLQSTRLSCRGTHDHTHLPHGFRPWETLLGWLGITTAVCDVQALRSEQCQHTLLHSSSRQSWSPQWGRRSCLGSTLQETSKACCVVL